MDCKCENKFKDIAVKKASDVFDKEISTIKRIQERIQKSSGFVDKGLVSTIRNLKGKVVSAISDDKENVETDFMEEISGRIKQSKKFIGYLYTVNNKDGSRGFIFKNVQDARIFASNLILLERSTKR